MKPVPYDCSTYFMYTCLKQGKKSAANWFFIENKQIVHDNLPRAVLWINDLSNDRKKRSKTIKSRQQFQWAVVFEWRVCAYVEREREKKPTDYRRELSIINYFHWICPMARPLQSHAHYWNHQPHTGVIELHTYKYLSMHFLCNSSTIFYSTYQLVSQPID